MTSRFVLPFADVGSGIKPSSGAKLDFFENDGVTRKDTHTTKAAITANDNPVIADSKGVFSDIYITGDYKVTLKDKDNTQIGTGLLPINEFAVVTDNVFNKNLATLATALSASGLVENDAVELREFIAMRDGGGLWDVRLLSAFPEDKIDIFALTGGQSPALSLVRRGAKASKTKRELTWFVDPVAGTDNSDKGTGTGANAFKTVQFAYDQLPTIITLQQTVQLADGTYDSSSTPGASQPRPAILWGHGKFTAFRSSSSGSDLIGPIVIKGNSGDNSAVKIQTVAEWNFGVYNNVGQLALQDLTINTSGGNGGILLTSHRNTSHIMCKNVVTDSVFTTRTTACISAESGGQIEYTDGKIKNSAIGALTLTSGDNITIATTSDSIFEGNDKAVLAKNNSFVSLNSLQDGVGKVEIIDSTNNIGIEAINGAHVSVRGQDGTTDMCQIAANINLEQAGMDLVFSETTAPVIMVDSNIKYNASNYQFAIAAQSSEVFLSTSNSFVSPAVANTDPRPVTLTDGASIKYSGTNVLIGSGGLPASYNPGALAFTGNGETKAILPGRDTYNVTNTSGTATGGQIDSTDVEEGRQIRILSKTNGVTFTSGTHMNLALDFTIGQLSGQLTGATLEMIDRKWKVTGLGQVEP